MNDAGLVRECIALRRATLALFAGAMEAESWARAAANVSPRAVWLFLATEACATLVRQRLGAATRSLSTEARAILEHASDDELKRMLAARMQLAIIDRAAERAGVAPVILKGGVPVAEGKNAFDLGDIDVLLPADDCERLAEELRALGGKGELSIRLPGTLKTDIHSHLDPGVGVASVTPALDSQPLTAYARLRRLRNVPHAAYVIQHCTTQHPNRRGNLRDLMLLAGALRDCTAGELAELSAALDRSPEAASYQRFLMRSVAINDGRIPEDDESVALTAAAHYTFSLRWPNTVGPVRYSLRGMATYFFGPPSDVWRAVRIYLLGPVRKGSFWTYHPITKRAPRLSALIGYVVRTPYRLALLLYAASVAMAFRLDYDRQLK